MKTILLLGFLLAVNVNYTEAGGDLTTISETMKIIEVKNAEKIDHVVEQLIEARLSATDSDKKSSSPISEYVQEMQALKIALEKGEADPMSVNIFIDSRRDARYKAEFMRDVFRETYPMEQLDTFDQFVMKLLVYPDIQRVREILVAMTDKHTPPDRLQAMQVELDRIVQVINEAREASQLAISEDEIKKMKEAADKHRLDEATKILELAINRNKVGATVVTSCEIIRENQQ